MKIKLLSTMIMALISAQTFAITDSIPNGGLERWYTTGWYEFPAEWITNNTQLLAPGVVTDQDAHSGILAMQLTNITGIIPEASCYFLVNLYHQNVGGYCKNNLLNNDSAVFVIRMFYHSQRVDSGRMVFYGGFNPLYAPFTIPITQGAFVPDSCAITIQGGQTYNSSISFDDLQFDFVQGIENIDKINLLVFPNPVIDGLVYFSGKLHGTVHITIYDVYGKIAEEKDIQILNQNTSLQTNLSSGVYLLAVECAGTRYIQKLLRL